jgi:hypothetical protein
MRHKIITALIEWGQSVGLLVDFAFCGDVAIFSPCRRYRYALTRSIGTSQRVLTGIGLNPSTANAFSNDPTIRRCIGFGQSWECGTYVMLNAYAFKATDPRDMWAAQSLGDDVIGEHNNAAIALVLGLMGDGVPLAAWGTHAEAERIRDLARIATDLRIDLQCLGTNKDGSPKHPLYLAANTPLQPWQMPRAA